MRCNMFTPTMALTNHLQWVNSSRRKSWTRLLIKKKLLLLTLTRTIALYMTKPMQFITILFTRSQSKHTRFAGKRTARPEAKPKICPLLRYPFQYIMQRDMPVPNTFNLLQGKWTQQKMLSGSQTHKHTPVRSPETYPTPPLP